MEPSVDVNELAGMQDAPDLPLSGVDTEEAAGGEELDLAEELARRDDENGRLRQDLERLERRISDTQAWGNQQSMARAAAEAAAASVREMLSQQGREQEQRDRARAQIPKLSQAEKEAILADPDLLEQAIERKVDYGFRYVMERVAPALQQTSQQAGRLAEVNATQSELLARVAIDQARELAERSGVPVEEFNRHLPNSYNYLVSASGGDDFRLRTLGTNPEAVLMAVNLSRNRNGVPVEKPAAPPSIGTRSRSPRAPKPELQIPAKAAEVWRRMGITPTAAMVEDYNKRMAGGAK